MIKIINTLFVTMFGLGKISKIPGTFGSLATVIILYLFFHIFNLSSNLVLTFLIVVFILSFLMIMNLQIISIKKINKNTIYFLSILLVLSIFLIVFFKFTAVPLILASYILLSTIFVKNEYL